MSHSIAVRAAAASDHAKLVAFNQAMAAETEDKPLNEDVLSAGVRRLLEAPEYGTYYVAERGDEVIGALMVTTEWSDWRNGLFWWIQSVYVAPEHRRSGVYRALHTHVRDLARAHPGVCGLRLYVERENHVAMRTYARLGMHETVYRMFEESFA
jgi:GNAT superfamily N-acetyltransferase